MWSDEVVLKGEQRMVASSKDTPLEPSAGEDQEGGEVRGQESFCFKNIDCMQFGFLKADY